VVTILIISAIVKRSLWRASPLARGARFYSGGGRPPCPPSPHWRRRWIYLKYWSGSWGRTG